MFYRAKMLVATRTFMVCYDLSKNNKFQAQEIDVIMHTCTQFDGNSH